MSREQVRNNSMINSFFTLFFKGIKVLFTRPGRAFQVFKNLFYDFKYTRTYMGIPLSNQNEIAGFTNTTSTEYSILEKLFSKINITNKDVIVDVGCGKGRVLAWLGNKKIQNKIIGVEIDKAVAQKTRKNMGRYEKIKILSGDVTGEAFPEDGTIFYLFNPFNELILRKFVKKIENDILKKHHKNKDVKIIYYNCCHLGVFEENCFWRINKLGDLNGLPAAIITVEFL